jgi:hypothetical protein
VIKWSALSLIQAIIFSAYHLIIKPN